MTDEERAILLCVKGRPDDDMPRLAYADYLDGVGETTRAAFIRAQIAEARVGERNTLPPPYSWLPCVATAQVWSSRFPEPDEEPGPGVSLVWWHRGFAEGWVLTAADWIAFADAITAEHPVRRVRFLTMPTCPPDVRNLGQNFRTMGVRYEIAGAVVEVPEIEVVLLRGRIRPVQEFEREVTAEICRRRWPGVAFELPPARNDYSAHVQAMRDEIMAQIRAAYIPGPTA